MNKVLTKPKAVERVDQLKYHSKTFFIETEWDGNRKYTVNVFNSKTKLLVESKTEETYDGADFQFENLKTKYILDHSNNLGGA